MATYMLFQDRCADAVYFAFLRPTTTYGVLLLSTLLFSSTTKSLMVLAEKCVKNVSVLQTYSILYI